MFCAACGTQNDDGNKFCRSCGTGLPPTASRAAATPSVAAPAPSREAAPAQAATGNACPACGRKFPATQRFCNTDGTALVAGPPGAGSSATPVTPPTPPAPPPTAPARPATTESLEKIETGSTVEDPIPHPPPVAAAPSPSVPLQPPTPPAAVVLPPLGAAKPVPIPATLAQSTAAVPAADATLQHCATCGLTYPAGVRFCDQDGSPLVAGGIAMTEAATSADEMPWLLPHPPFPLETPVDDSFDDDRAPNRFRFVPVITAAALLLLFVGGGYVFWSGAFDRSLGPDASSKSRVPTVAEAIDDPEAIRDSLKKTPSLLGRYTAHLADQDIVLAIEQGTPTSGLLSLSATLTYSNAVNGGTCTASLTATGDREGSTPGFAVSFRQGPVPGQPSCPAELPVTLDITGQPTDANGVVASISAEWRKPDSDDVLMKGILLREAGQ